MAPDRVMNITVLGSGTCVPSLERRPCSILIQWNHMSILVDAGPGIMGQLLKAGVKITDIDLILLSHFHLDHSAEVAPFIFALKYSGMNRTKRLTLGGGPGLNAFFNRLNLAHDNSLEMDGTGLTILELSPPGSLDAISPNPANGPAPLKVSCSRVAHRPESLAYRFEEPNGFSLVYSGDTDMSDELVGISKNADLLICESSFPDDKKRSGHLTPSLAGDIAARARVKRLVLTHFYPECEDADILAQCRKSFSGPVVRAKDLLRL